MSSDIEEANVIEEIIVRPSTVLSRILNLALTVFVDFEIKRKFSADAYRSAILFFAGHKLPLSNSFCFTPKVGISVGHSQYHLR